VVGSLCFAASTTIRIRLRGNLSVTTAAAIAPAVAVSGGMLVSGGSPDLLLLAPSLPSIVVMALARRSIPEMVGHTLLYSLAALSLAPLVGSRGPGPINVLAVGVLGCVVYAAFDFLLQRARAQSWEPLRDLRRMWWLLHVVVVSASGLTILVLEQLSWGAFVAMAAVLGITKHEFEAFAISRTAFEQTNTALSRLRERAATD
jgi:hypothetical protein